MYNSFGQPSFGQQSFGQQQQGFGQQVQSQYRGLQKTFQPTGAVQSFYQPQQTTSIGSNYGSNYHTSSYVGNQPNHDSSSREDSQSPTGMSMQSQNYHTSSYRGNQPNHDSSFREDSQSPTGMSMQTQNYHTSSYRGNQANHDSSFREDSFQPSTYRVQAGTQSFGGSMTGLQGSFQPQSAGFQGTNSYHTQNYVGNRQDHDAYLREDSLRASTYATGRTQGIATLNGVQGTYNVNTPTSQFTQGQGNFGSFRNF
ncbi:MAG TPA: hypothetical protein VEZ72_00510 [Paenibacillus sp.]|nr:hypothetical protein [Paenibacillus sp.]